MTANEDRVYRGVKAIAQRIDVGRDRTRKLLQEGVIRGYRTKSGNHWYCVESELNEDIGQLPGKL